jgi:hypothetical protein
LTAQKVNGDNIREKIVEVGTIKDLYLEKKLFGILDSHDSSDLINFGKRSENSTTVLTSPQLIDVNDSYWNLFISGMSTQIINSTIVLNTGDFSGNIITSNSTFVGSGSNSSITLSYGDWFLNSGPITFQNLSIYITDFDAWLTFTNNTNATFDNCNIYITQGFLNLDNSTELTFSPSFGIYILWNGHLRSGAQSRINGNVWNMDGYVSSYPEPDSPRFYDEIYELSITGRYLQSPTGESVFRIKGYGADRVSSMMIVDSAELHGIIRIINDEGLDESDEFIVFQLDPD